MSRRTSNPRPSYIDPPSTSNSDVDASGGGTADETDTEFPDAIEAAPTSVSLGPSSRVLNSHGASTRTQVESKDSPGKRSSGRIERTPAGSSLRALSAKSRLRTRNNTRDETTAEGDDNDVSSNRVKRSKYFVPVPQAASDRESGTPNDDELTPSDPTDASSQSQSDDYQEPDDDDGDDDDDDDNDETGEEDRESVDSDTLARRIGSKGTTKKSKRTKEDTAYALQQSVLESQTAGTKVVAPQLRKLDYGDIQKQRVKAKTKAKVKAKAEAKADDSSRGGEVFIRNLPALPAGNTPYRATTIHPNTLLFLTDLKQNNERDWFQQRDLQFRAGKSDFEDFVLRFAKMLQEHDDTIPELPVKDLVFRIYRDVRFSNDRTPYKTNMSAALSRTGRKGAFACYYLSIEPSGKTMLGCGSWCPPSQDLRKIRRHIDRHADEWDDILSRPEFVQFFKGFEGLLETEDKLKTCPKGYPKDHDRIELLKLKSFTIGIRFSDEEVTSESFLEILDLVVEQMVPFVTLLNGIIRPENLSSESDTTEND